MTQVLGKRRARITLVAVAAGVLVLSGCDSAASSSSTTSAGGSASTGSADSSGLYDDEYATTGSAGGSCDCEDYDSSGVESYQYEDYYPEEPAQPYVEPEPSTGGGSGPGSTDSILRDSERRMWDSYRSRTAPW